MPKTPTIRLAFLVIIALWIGADVTWGQAIYGVHRNRLRRPNAIGSASGRPTMSPYMQLFREDVVGGATYNVFVQPEIRRRRFVEQQNRRFGQIEQQIFAQQQRLNQRYRLNALPGQRPGGLDGQLTMRPHAAGAAPTPSATSGVPRRRSGTGSSSWPGTPCRSCTPRSRC